MPLTIGTWNVFHGSVPGNPAGTGPLDRMRSFAAYASTFAGGGMVDVLCFQEVPQAVINSATSMAQLTATGYAALSLAQEYPTGVAPANNSTDGYVVLYNPARLRPDPADAQLAFANSAAFMQGAAQGRPPVEIKLTSQANGAAVTIVNWHNEAGAPAVGAIVGLHNTYIGRSGNVVIAGDFNVGAVALKNPAFPGWNAVYNGLDFILTNTDAIQDMGAAAFVSDVHTGFCTTLNSINI